MRQWPCHLNCSVKGWVVSEMNIDDCETGVNWSERVNQALDRLVRGCVDAGEVAALLVRWGFAGTANDCWTCPLAVYVAAALRDVLPYGWRVSVDGAGVSLFVSLFAGGLEMYQFPLPAVLTEFVVQMDEGKYPHLEVA
jgi:hypothetical protein